MSAAAFIEPLAPAQEAQPPEVAELAWGAPCHTSGRGKVWQARWAGSADGADGADGSQAAWPLRGRAVPLPPGDRGRERAVRVAHHHLDVRHDHLVSLVDALPWREGVVLVSEATPVALTLRAALERWGSLSPGQVVTLGLPLLDALALLHSSGLTHGGAAMDDILVAPDGRPLLAGVGFSAVVGSAGSSTEDVQQLVNALHEASGGDPSRALQPLRNALASGADAHSVAAVLKQVAAPAPLVPTGPVTPSRRRRRARGRWTWRPGRRSALVAACALGAVGGVAALGWSTTTSPRGAAPPSPVVHAPAAGPVESPGAAAASAPSTASDWSAVMSGLDLARSRAFREGSSALLAEVDAPASRALLDDESLVRQVSERGWKARDLHLRLQSVQVASVLPERVELRVVDTLDPYDFVAPGGAVAQRVAGRGEVAHEITLRQAQGGWRVEAVHDLPK